MINPDAIEGAKKGDLAGRKSAAGKGRSASNALSHGLSIPIWSNPKLAAEAESLARRIAGFEPTSDALGYARRFAEAQIDLERVRRTRAYYWGEQSYKKLDAAAAKRDAILSVRDAWVRRCCEFALNIAPAFDLLTSQLAKLDRYEARAMSRRNRASEMLDAVRAFEAFSSGKDTAA